MDFIRPTMGKGRIGAMYRHVYCVNCVYWEELAETIMRDSDDVPDVCKKCYPYDFEDSRGNDLRTKYKEQKLKWM